jgi:hypothetical protein
LVIWIGMCFGSGSGGQKLPTKVEISCLDVLDVLF